MAITYLGNTLETFRWDNIEQLIQEAEKLDAQVEELYKTSVVLPKIPDFEFLDRLCVELVEKSLGV